MRLDTREALASTHAALHGDAATLPQTFAVSTDTRTLEAGDAFVALRGEHFDGHAFLAQAVVRGASVLVVDDAGALSGAEGAQTIAGIPAFVVADTTTAYLELGALARRHSAARFVAVTGSTGKTTTRALLAQLLEAVAPGRVAGTAANENNEIGVAKTLLAIPNDAAYVAVELGARHYGEIAPLARAAQPDVAVLTNIGDAHLEIMGSPERLAETKWGIFATGASAVLNVADDVSRERASLLAAPPTWFGLDHEADRYPFETLAAQQNAVCVLLHGRERIELRIRGGSRSYPCRVTLPGEHNRRNVVAALAAAYALGADLEAIPNAVETLHLPPGRYERRTLVTGEAIYDAYNASMGGTLATLRSFAQEPAMRRIAVLASMAELGEHSAEMHANVGAAAADARFDALLVGGDFATDLARGARGASHEPTPIVPFADNAAAIDWLRTNLRPGDLVLFKGSHRYGLEKVVEALAPSAPNRAHAAAKGAVANGAIGDGATANATKTNGAHSNAGLLVAGRSRPDRRRAPFGYECAAIPIRTRLVGAHDDVAALVAAAVRGIARADDVVCVSETAVAIAQNRYVAAETVRPSRLAYLLSRRAGALATVNQPESLQLVIDAVGPWRVIAAALAHVAGKVLRRRGLFYRVLGGTIATIDGYTGTLPPFERTIVLGPRDPDGVAAQIAARCRARAVVVDANDLGAVNVLGASPHVDRARVADALRSNPHGNGDEQTPIVVLVWRGADRSPFVTSERPWHDTRSERAA